MYIFGGKQGETEYSSSVLKWSNDSGIFNWMTLDGQLATGLHRHQTILNNGQVFHIGGCPKLDRNTYSSTGCDNKLRIERWDEEQGSNKVMEIPEIHPMSYVVPIFWTKNVYGVDNWLTL